MSGSSVFGAVDLHSRANNTEHHTSEISVEQLIVRRGQPFTLTVELRQPFNPDLHPLTLTAVTGFHHDEDQGTKSCFGIPDNKQRSPTAKAVWKVELQSSSSQPTSTLTLIITPPADTPIGTFKLTANHRDEDKMLASPAVLFNPWCSDDSVFLPDEDERQEYVMNEQGIIFVGGGRYISSRKWDFGHFEEDMVEICLTMLNVSHKHFDDPAADVAARWDPVYISRLVSAMINSEDDCGVLKGQWGGPYIGGFGPGHWDGSHNILQRWYNSDCHPVKYGQCWVFAGVMCSVMRLLGIPCRVITNFQSAHDCNKSLTIDVYHFDYGVEEKETKDSIWNFHVWVEAWMKRPDLAEDGKYDGWQVLDPTPQETSDGVYCCGPASVKSLLSGETTLQYDVPFVFAEVNADCIDWMVKADGSKVNIFSDIKRVGQNISTKSVGSDKRMNITDTYKHREGSVDERAVFKYAISRDYRGAGGEEEEESGGSADEDSPTPPPELFIEFEEVSEPLNGEDVRLKLVMHSEIKVPRPLSIKISAQGMRYNGSPVVKIQNEVKEETLQPQKVLSIPILIPFSAYHKHMMECDSIKVTAMITDKQWPDNTYLAEDDVVLRDPPISVTLPQARLYQEGLGEVCFRNPLQETLTGCSLTLSGSGLVKEELECSIPDLRPNMQVRVKFLIIPYKTGKKTLVADFQCSVFKDIKGSCTVNVAP